MKSSEFINELFDPSAAYQYVFNEFEDGFVEARAETKDGRPLVVEFTDDGNGVQVAFSVDSRIKLTNGGDATRIMTTVLKIIKEYCRGHHPSELYFSSFDPSRSTLYRAICTRFAKDSGFVAEVHKISSQETAFVLYKK